MRRHLYKQRPRRVLGRVWVVGDVLVVLAAVLWLVVVLGLAWVAMGRGSLGGGV